MTNRLKRESGVVSIMVTMVMMIVITLIVLGFAEISRNEQRSSLDNQLSTQAYYAAESGVNDARAVINAAVAASQPVSTKSSCADTPPQYQFNALGQNWVDQSHNTEYTCVTINPNPTSLGYDVGYTSTVIPIISNGAAFNTLTLVWNAKDGTVPAGCYTNPATELHLLPDASSWGCNYPILRVDILNASVLDSGGSLTRANWANNTATMFFVPFNTSEPSNGTLADRGTAIPTTCTALAGNCTATISLGGTGRTYYMRVTTLYQQDFHLTISAGGLPFSNAQALIDSTGKAQDVLRRVLVSVDLTDANSHNTPSAAIISQDSVCKRFSTTNGSYEVYEDLSAGNGGAPNSLCSAPTSQGSPLP